MFSDWLGWSPLQAAPRQAHSSKGAEVGDEKVGQVRSVPVNKPVGVVH